MSYSGPFFLRACPKNHVPVGYAVDEIYIDSLELAGMAERMGYESEREALVDTLLHEMVHMWCEANGIRDVTDGEHNELFRVAALAHGLDCGDTPGTFGATGISIAGWATITTSSGFDDVLAMLTG